MIFFYKEALKIPLPYRRNRSGVITSEISYSLSECITVDDNFRNYSVSKFDILTLNYVTKRLFPFILSLLCDKFVGSEILLVFQVVLDRFTYRRLKRIEINCSEVEVRVLREGTSDPVSNENENCFFSCRMQKRHKKSAN